MRRNLSKRRHHLKTMGGKAMLSLYELGAILLVALIIFGPKKLPEIGKALGKSIKEFKNGKDEVDKNTVDSLPGPTASVPKDEKSEK